MDKNYLEEIQKDKKDLEEVQRIKDFRGKINSKSGKSYTMTEIAQIIGKSIFYVSSRLNPDYAPIRLRAILMSKIENDEKKVKESVENDRRTIL